VSRSTLSTGLLQITATAVLWGTAGPAVAVIGDLTTLGPTSIGFYRLAIAATALAATRRFWAFLHTARAAPVRLLLAGVGLGVYQVLYFLAVVEAGVGVATVVSLGLAPIVTTAWESARARRRPGRRQTAALAAGLGGLLLITLAAPALSGTRPVLGLLAAIGSGLGYAATTLVSRDLAQRADPITLTGATSVIGALALLPVAAADGLTLPLAPEPLALLTYVGVVATALAYALFYAGLRTVPGSVAAVLTLLEPLVAALLAVLVLAEPLSALTVTGGVLLLSAVAALYLRSGSG
jgi:drug/metabolite transporter (DMT)-like permease